MAMQDAGFVDKHIEKVALGVCALVLAGAIGFAFLGDRFVVNDVGPSELAQGLETEAESTARAVVAAKPPGPKPAQADGQDTPAVELHRWFADNADGLIKIADVESPVARTQPYPPPFLSTTEGSKANRHDLVRVVRPGIPIVSTGRTSFELPINKPDLADYDGEGARDTAPAAVRNWAAVACQVDLVQQDINFRLAKYPRGSYLAVVKVHLQRVDLALPQRGWQNVDTFLPFNPPERPVADSDSGFRLSALTQFREQIDPKQEYIARSLLPDRKAGDRITYPAIPYFPDPPEPGGNAANRSRAWLKLAESAVKGKRPFGAEDLDAAFVLLRAVLKTNGVRQKDEQRATDLLKSVARTLRRRTGRKSAIRAASREPEMLMPIVAHDLDLRPDHTYVYRMRYEVFNYYAGDSGELTDPADADKLAVLSNWSPPSREVVIQSGVRFFLTKASGKKGAATVTVYKRSRGTWESSDFEVDVGGEIGGVKVRRGGRKIDFATGSVCVDIDFDRKTNGKSDVALVYVDENDGKLREVLLRDDKKAHEAFRRGQLGGKAARR